MSASLVDSAAAFKEKLVERGLGPLKGKFDALGWTTFANFGVASEYVPGTGDATLLVKEIYDPLLGTTPEAGMVALKPAIKRLFVESWTLLSADLAKMVDRRDEDKPAKIPGPEREVRRKTFNAAHDMEVVGDLEPSWHLQDLAHGMHEGNEIRFLEWKYLSRRDEEVKACEASVDLYGNLRDMDWSSTPGYARR